MKDLDHWKLITGSGNLPPELDFRSRSYTPGVLTNAKFNIFFKVKNKPTKNVQLNLKVCWDPDPMFKFLFTGSGQKRTGSATLKLTYR